MEGVANFVSGSAALVMLGSLTLYYKLYRLLKPSE